MARHTVYIIDDSTDGWLPVAYLLKKQGVDVETFADVDDAKARLLAAPSMPRLLIVDFLMPMTSGIELVAWLKEHCPRPLDEGRVRLCTQLDDEEVSRRIAGTTAADVPRLRKDLDLLEMVDVIAGIVNS